MKRCHIYCTRTLRQTQVTCKDENIRGQMMSQAWWRRLFLDLQGLQRHMVILHPELWPCLVFPLNSFRKIQSRKSNKQTLVALLYDITLMSMRRNTNEYVAKADHSLKLTSAQCDISQVIFSYWRWKNAELLLLLYKRNVQQPAEATVSTSSTNLDVRLCCRIKNCSGFVED